MGVVQSDAAIVADQSQLAGPNRDAVLTTAQWLVIGVSEGQLRGPGFVRLHHGVYTPASNPALDTLGLQARAAVVAVGGKAAVGGLTA